MKSFCLFSSDSGWENSKPDIREVFRPVGGSCLRMTPAEPLNAFASGGCAVNARFRGRPQSPPQMLQNEVCLDQTSTGIWNRQVLLERRPHISAASVTFTTVWGGSAG